MEKQTLTRFEDRCIQEEPPPCTAACPFHIEVKPFLAKMADKAFDPAFKVLEKRLPLPEVLARVCDHPCEAACVRTDIDAPIAIGDLERLCVQSRSRQKKYFPPPQKDLTVGIWGSGPSSLTAAWDLSLKGYPVRVYFPGNRPGGKLKQLSPTVLPPSVLDGEIKRIKAFGALFFPDTSFDAFEDKAGEFDALFFGLDGDAPPKLPEDLDFVTLREGESTRFFGGFSDSGSASNALAATAVSSPVWFAFQGRRAATSMDRLLSKVSMAAGREREGPFDTRLDTDTDRIVPAPRVDFARPEGSEDWPFDTDLAALEAGRCHQCDCSRCIRACNTFIESFGGFPGRYAREIYNNLSIVMGERKANLMINSCTACDLCKHVCPNDFSMAELCLSARREMADSGKMPPSAHEFALAEMAHAMGEQAAFAVHAPGQTASEILFFPGCQLIGSAPAQAARAWEWLRQAVNPASGIVAGCCGAPAFWAGRQELSESAKKELLSLWTAWGEPEIVTACTSCGRMLEGIFPEKKITSLYEKMADNPPQKTEDGELPKTLAISDPCTARGYDAVQAAVRALVQTAGIRIEELEASADLTECCGFGGLTFNANPDMGRQIVSSRAAQSSLPYLAYCAMCRDRLARTGKACLHILDLFWPETKDPAARPDEGFSGRRMSRIRFKADITGSVSASGTATSPVSASGKKILVADEVLDAMEGQFILISDLETLFAGIKADETAGFVHKGRGTRIVSKRAGNVTFWAEFIQEDESFRVQDAWCHRMTVAESKSFIEGKPSEDHDPKIRCAGCGKELVFFKNHVEYLGSRFDVDLPQCPDCGAVYISPKLSRTKMAEVEHILEDK